MSSDKKGPQPISGLIGDALRLCGLHERMVERSLLSRWPEVVGEEIARHSRAVDLQDGVLVLEADHGAWRQELTLLMPRIKEKFNALQEGSVREIRWRHGPRTGRGRGNTHTPDR